MSAESLPYQPHPTLRAALSGGYRLEVREARLEGGAFIGEVFVHNGQPEPLFDNLVTFDQRGIAEFTVTLNEEVPAMRAIAGEVAGALTRWSVDPLAALAGETAPTPLSIPLTFGATLEVTELRRGDDGRVACTLVKTYLDKHNLEISELIFDDGPVEEQVHRALNIDHFWWTKVRDTIMAEADSRFPVPKKREGSGIGNGEGVVHMATQTEPEARRGIVGTLVPEGCTTSIYGDGGQGKSLLTMGIALHIVTGRDFLGLVVERRTVLYVDAELDVDEFTRRCFAIARGMGLDGPPDGLYYYRLPGSLADPQVQQLALAAAEGCGASLVILDSLTVAASGSDLKDAGDTTAILQALRDWKKTIITIDHIAKPPPGANLSGYRAFGSVFKWNLARSVLQLVRAEGGGVVLRQVKHNFGPLAAPLHLAQDFGPDRVTFRRLELTDEAMAGIEQHLTAPDRVLLALADYHKGTDPEQLAKDVEMSPKTVRNHLTALKQQGRVIAHGDGRWEVPGSRPAAGNGNGAAA